MNKTEAKIKIKTTIEFIKSAELKEQIKKQISNRNLLEIIESSQKIEISLVMLVRDQEEIIAEVLNRVKTQNLNAYIVVDTGSNDGTKEILKRLSYISLYEFAWIEDYSLMRNEAVKFSKTDWILTLDSDEILDIRLLDLRLLIYLILQVKSEIFSINFEQHSAESSSYGVPARLYNAKIAHYVGSVHEGLRTNLDGQTVQGILTNIQIENKGSSDEEKQRFSKDERYTKLLFKMMKKEPDNPRWFALLPSLGIRELVEKRQYDILANKYLFKTGVFMLDEHNILVNSYTRTIIEKYVVFLMESNKTFEARNLIEFGLKLFPKDIYLMFYQSLFQIEEIKHMIRLTLKENLSQYLSLDKQEIYYYNYTDTQLLEIVLAELNDMIGNHDATNSIIREIQDKNVLKIWEKWHP